jgi:hypothetical protein
MKTVAAAANVDFAENATTREAFISCGEKFNTTPVQIHAARMKTRVKPPGRAVVVNAFHSASTTGRVALAGVCA